MRFHTYSKFSPEMADAVDLQSLLDKLADFLLQSGFAGGEGQPHYGMGFEDPGDRSLDARVDDHGRAMGPDGVLRPPGHTMGRASTGSGLGSSQPSDSSNTNDRSSRTPSRCRMRSSSAASTRASCLRSIMGLAKPAVGPMSG